MCKQFFTLNLSWKKWKKWPKMTTININLNKNTFYIVFIAQWINHTEKDITKKVLRILLTLDLKFKLSQWNFKNRMHPDPVTNRLYSKKEEAWNFSKGLYRGGAIGISELAPEPRRKLGIFPSPRNMKKIWRAMKKIWRKYEGNMKNSEGIWRKCEGIEEK